MAANSLRRHHNPVFREFYWKKHHESHSHHMRALTLTAKKLVNLVFYLLKNNTPYVVMK